MFKKIKIGTKLIGGFVIVAIVAAIIGIVSLFQMSRVENNNIKALDSQEYEILMNEMKQAHLQWYINAGKFQQDEKIVTLGVETNPHNCTFGKWFYSEEKIKILQKIPQLQALLAEIEPLHNQFHESAVEIESYLKAGYRNEALVFFGTEAVTKTAKCLQALGDMIDIAKKNSNLFSTQASLVFENAILIITIIIIICLIISVSLGIIITLSITRPLALVVKAGAFIALGQFPEKNLDVRSQDEIGTLTEVLNNIVVTLKIKGHELQKIADGDMTVAVKYASDKDQFATQFDKMIKSLNEVLSQVNSSVQQVSSGSNQISSASQSLSQGASEQASSLEEITASIAEINSQSKQNADNADQANGFAKTARVNAETGNKKMKELVSAMAAINKSSEEIKKVIKVIDDIAFQINLLALNANVEAARAGKYGKGFAVVAEEVRNLAGRSAQAVKETTEMVETSIQNIANGNVLVAATAKQLDDIVIGAAKVVDLVDKIAAASKEQASGLDQINVGIGQVDQVTQANTASAEECASASEELASQATQLKSMIARFQLSQLDNANDISAAMIQRLVQEALAGDKR